MHWLNQGLETTFTVENWHKEDCSTGILSHYLTLNSCH